MFCMSRVNVTYSSVSNQNVPSQNPEHTAARCVTWYSLRICGTLCAHGVLSFQLCLSGQALPGPAEPSWVPLWDTWGT